MFKILGLMILGIIIGYGLRRISFLRKVEVSISQAALLALSATVGSILASWLVLKLFFTSKKKKV